VERGQREPPCPEPLELVVVAGDAMQVARLPAAGTVTLGRGEECEIRIDNGSVSRRHAALHLGEVLRIQDLGSANGTFMRDSRAVSDTASTYPLRRLSREIMEIAIGERVNLGAIPILVRRVPAAPGAAAAQRLVVVRDSEMRALYEQASRAARSSISVLVLGETGVGKEVLARTIHEQSPRAGEPFVELNCAALAPSLLESELFGHEKNAFTGANQARPGLLESGDGGTIFLDEIGELPLPVQVKLLRVLENRKVMRLGGRTPRKLDVRFIAATNRDLKAATSDGSFREDLYFRLDGISLEIPPLRKRVAEIVPLAEAFLAEAGRGIDRMLRMSPEVLGYLERYSWPGNVREVRNVIERAAVLSTGDVIVPADLPRAITGVARSSTAPSASARTGPPDADPAPPAANADEKQRIIAALDQCVGNQTRAAKLLGISLRTLVNRLDEYHIPRPRK
jgi:two-component system response regulator AtoC